jgi:mutator protein MutT
LIVTKAIPDEGACGRACRVKENKIIGEDFTVKEGGIDRPGHIAGDGKKSMSRRYPGSPMVGVGAIIFRENSVLLVQRGREPSLGQWTLPGGLVELGESLEEAVRREVMEEVGLNVEVKNLVVALDRVIFDSEGKIEYHYILLDFLCEAEHQQPYASSDVTACLFVPLNQFSGYDLTKGTAEVIRRAVLQREQIAIPIYDPKL